MNAAIDKFFTKDVKQLTTQLSAIEDRIEPLSWPEDKDILRELAGVMHAGLEACRRLDREIGENADLIKSCQERFRKETAPWCEQSWIINRARTKPSGFPGDYQMLSAIYDGIPISRGLGGYLDRLCLKMTLGRAVDARLKDARRFLQEELAVREGDVTVLDVASGPGREFRGGLHVEGSRRVHVKCVDSDDKALNYVSRHVAKTAPRNLWLDCYRHNALRMRSAKSIVEKFGQSDIIYSVGLADYIPNKLLIPMLRAWRESLNPGGVVYLGFKDALRYDKVEYQWLMDWHFLQRTEGDCLHLLGEAGYDLGQLETARDETGVILQYTYRPTVPARVRLDVSEAKRPVPHAAGVVATQISE